MRKLSINNIIRDGSRSVAVVQQSELDAGESEHRHFLFASLTPVAVVIRDPGQTSAFDLEARPVDWRELGLEPAEVEAAL